MTLTRHPHRVLAWMAFALLASDPCYGHEWTESEVKLSCDVAQTFGTLTTPAHRLGQDGSQSKRVCAVLVGGTLSNTRDGGMARDGVPERDALKKLARSLAVEGYASIRYDKVGFGKSQRKEGWRGTYTDEAKLTAAAVDYARTKVDRVDKVVVLGESAGAYLACLAAKAGTQADAYIFLGGHCDSGAAIYEYNFARLVRLTEQDEKWKQFTEQHLRFEIALGRSYQAMFAAASEGASTFKIVDGDFSRTVDLARRKEELDMPPYAMFRFIQTPALALSGQYDLNVPPDHASRIVGELRRAGNHRCTCVLIANADHSFQLSPENEQDRLRERYSFESFRREYSPQLYTEIVKWLDDTFGYAASSKLPPSVGPEALPVRGVQHVEYDRKTDFAPARTHLAPGIQIVEDITEKQQTTGVATLEGEIGPLLLGNDCQAHFIDMPAGMYCEEHPHNSESIIYTVRGQWVLCSQGRRHVMKPGTLFHFAPNTPTGYEVPFPENAYILIFKGQRLTKNEKDFIQYLQGLARRLEQEHHAGVPYLLKDLPDGHPANVFARQVQETGKTSQP